MTAQRTIRIWTSACGAAALVAAGTSFAWGGDPVGREELREPLYRVSKITPEEKQLDAISQHPLDSVLQLAADLHQNIVQNVDDYTCTLIKRENVNGTLLPYEYMQCKVRNHKVENERIVEPFSVYLKFLKPDAVKGREVIFVEGQNNNQLVAHETGIKGRLVGSVNLDPNSFLAMRGNRYPITEIGIETLCRRLIEKGQRDRQLGECEVRVLDNATVGNRVCTCFEVTHHQNHPQLDFHRALVFMDKEMRVPIRYEAYDFPRTQGGQSELIEEYTYMNLKLNVGLTDEDFSPRNPRYGF